MLNLSQLRQLGDAPLADLLNQMASSIAVGPAGFGLTAANATAMSNAAADFETALLDWNAARVAADSAIVTKNEQRETTLNTFTTYLNLMYATPTVPDATVASIGLAPRSDTRTTVIPQQPIDFVATPFADGTVKLTWGTNGNPYGVIYEIEKADINAADWSLVFSTTKKTIILSDAPPGVIQYFRVTATKNGTRSQPSFIEGIYLPQPGAQIQIAA